MDVDTALDLARANRQSVLVTVRRNGRPQLSNVIHNVGEDGVIRVSTTATRAKYANLRREPWAAFHVTRADFFAYAVLEGEAELAPVAADPSDATVDELVHLYLGLSGTTWQSQDRAMTNEDWDGYRRTMVQDRRTVIRFRPGRAYGMLGPPQS